MEGSTESDIREKARARQSFRSAKYAQNMFGELERCGFIRRIPQERVSSPGRKPSPRIEINPTLRGSDFSDKRQFTNHTSNKSDKSEGGVEELSEKDRQYLDAERAGIQMEEAPEPAENPTLDVLTKGVV